MDSMRRHLDRRKRFVSSTRWVNSARGVERIRQNGIALELVQHGGAYRLRICGQMGKKCFPTAVDGKAEAFDLLETGAIAKWVEKQGVFPRHR